MLKSGPKNSKTGVNMKKQIFIRTYAIPIILIISFTIRLIVGIDDFKTVIGFFFVFAVFSRTLLTDKRYITDYHFTSDSLQINYLTQFFYSLSLEFKLTQIPGVEHVKRTDLLFWSPTLELKVNDVWIEFQIATKELHITIKNDFSSSNPIINRFIEN
jgi:hypothetical protein